MKKILFSLAFIILSEAIISEPLCIETKNHCIKCHPTNNLCLKCDKEIYTPDSNGGCEYFKNCIMGSNFCTECEEKENLCKECDNGFFPDEYGGCSYTNNCKISYRGECLECKEDYILIGEKDISKEGIRVCKSLISEEYKNCKSIDEKKGKCIQCNDGYYLNEYDKKCTKTKFCKESQYGVCKQCIINFYLDKSSDECKEKTEFFKHCKESIDGITCSVCEDNYFFDDDNLCTIVKYCSKSKSPYECEECISGYYLTEYEESCTPEKNCHYGNRELGICTVCQKNYYIDINDGKCKPNTEDNEFKNCYKANRVCTQCINEYFIGEDNMCSLTDHCAYSEDGQCLECSNDYFLDLDNHCIDVENCIHSLGGHCLECKDNYYYNRRNNTCLLSEGDFEHCKSGYDDWICQECKNDFYLNQSDYLCYSNEEKDNFYKCARTQIGEDICIECIPGYYLGEKDNKCTKIEGCDISENENKCIECSQNYCFDVKNGTCGANDKIINEEKKFYFKCNRTNKEGTACEECLKGYSPNEKGLCINSTSCEERQGDICIKCNSSYCLNSDFECVTSYYGNCIECNNVLDFDFCEKCEEGYELNKYNICVEKDEDIN